MTLKAFLDDRTITDGPDGMKHIDLVAHFALMPLSQLRGDEFEKYIEGNRIYLALLDAVPDYLLGEDGLKSRERMRKTVARDKERYAHCVAPYLPHEGEEDIYETCERKSL